MQRISFAAGHPQTQPSCLLSQLTSTKVLRTKPIKYGSMHEKDALAMYSKVMPCVGQLINPIKYLPSGFIIGAKEPWLGATPDAIMGSGIIVNVKYPFISWKCQIC